MAFPPTVCVLALAVAAVAVRCSADDGKALQPTASQERDPRNEVALQ